MLNEMANLNPQPVLHATKWSGLGCFLLILSLTMAGCGGGGSSNGSSSAASYSLHSGVVQKGPFISGSSVTAQELDQNLSPIGEQFVTKVSTNIGTFVLRNSINSRYISVSANGYYFDEVQNGISNDTVTLNAYGDLESSGSVNVNLLTTLTSPRIQTLMTQYGLDFQAARVRAQKEVLAAFHIRAFSIDFNQLDIARQRDSDYALLAISGIFLQASVSDNLSQLITDFQSDIADNGVIDNSSLKQTITDASKSLNADAIASNITAEYKSLVTLQNNFRGQDIVQWIDQDGNGIIQKYKYVTENAQASTEYQSPVYVAGADDDLGIVSSVTGTLIVNKTAVPNGTVIHAGDEISLSLKSGPQALDTVIGEIMINSTPVAQFTVITAPVPISVAAKIESIGTPSRLALSPDDLSLYIASMPTTAKSGAQTDDGGLYVYDITDPTTPSELKLVQYPVVGLLAGYYGVTMSADGNTAYIASSQQEMQIIDLTYVNSPALISRIATDGLAMSIVGSPGLSSLFVGTSGYSVQQFDISSPSNPLLTNSEATTIQPWGMSISPDNTQLVAFSSKNPGTDLIDLSTSTKLASSNVTSAVYCGNQILFAVGASGDQLTYEIIDLSNPSMPASVGLGAATISSVYTGSGIGVSYEQNVHMAYIVVQGEVFLIDLSDLAKPRERGSLLLPTAKNSSNLLLNPGIIASSDGKQVYVSWRTTVFSLKIGD